MRTIGGSPLELPGRRTRRSDHRRRKCVKPVERDSDWELRWRHAPHADRSRSVADLHRGRTGPGRRARGLRLNVPEATALIADTVCEAARDGARLMDAAAAGARGARPSTTCCPACPTSSARSRSRRCSTTARAWWSCATRSATAAASAPMHPVRSSLRLAQSTSSSRPRPSRRHQHVRRAGQHHVALPLLRGQPAAVVRSRRGVRHAPGDPGRFRAAVRARRGDRCSADADRRRQGRDRVRRPGRRPARCARRQSRPRSPAPPSRATSGPTRERRHRTGTRTASSSTATTTARCLTTICTPTRSCPTTTRRSTARRSAIGCASATPAW